MAIEQPVWLRSFGAESFLRKAEAELCLAYQPIVDIHTGKTVAFESLVRNVAEMGCATPAELFDQAESLGCLFDLDTCLLTKAMTGFTGIDAREGTLLFLNVDGRNLGHWRKLRTILEFQCDRLGLRQLDICIELSEAHQPLDPEGFAEAVAGLRGPSLQIAIDDFGTGNAGMQMLYQSNPDLIKIDRFFIKSMPDDAKKRLLVSTIVDLAHTLGIRVVAEGVESAEELASCREVNCDLVQGYLVDKPACDTGRLALSYPGLQSHALDSLAPADTVRVDIVSDEIAILSSEATLQDLFDVMERNPEQSVFPVVEGTGRPWGAVCERDLKPLLYPASAATLRRTARSACRWSITSARLPRWRARSRWRAGWNRLPGVRATAPS